MKICFYNMNHIGDIYFASIFINIICNLNNNIDFYYYFINGDIFIKNLSNIKSINKLEEKYSNNLINGNPPEDLLDKSLLNILIQNQMQIVGSKILMINNTNIIFINTWCVSEYLKHADFDLKSGITSYSNLIKIINTKYKLNLIFNINSPLDLIKNMNYYETDENNDENAKNDFTNTIFIFNFVARSVNVDMNKLKNYILQTSKTNKIILSCYNNIFDNNTNIKFIDKDYNINMSPSCKNLIDLWEIASKCKNVILLPTGSSWSFFHKLNILKENQLYMFNDNNYCNSLNSNINFLLNENKNLIGLISF